MKSFQLNNFDVIGKVPFSFQKGDTTTKLETMTKVEVSTVESPTVPGTTIHKLLVNFPANTSEFQRRQVRAYYKSLYGHFEVTSCPLLNNGDELWTFNTPFTISEDVPPNDIVADDQHDVLDRTTNTIVTINVILYNANNITSCGPGF